MININLLPPEIKKKIALAKQTANVFSICLVTFILVVVVTLLLSVARQQLFMPNLESSQSNIQRIMADLDKYKTYEDQALFLNDRTKVAASIEEKRPIWSQIIQEMINSVPNTVQFENFTADTKKSPNFVLSGSTVSEREIIRFKEKLETSKFFKNVAFKSSSTTGENTNKVKFSLEFDLEQYFISTKEK